MSIAATVNQIVDRMSPGRIFGCEVFPQYRDAPGAVVRAVNRCVDSGQLKRVSKGRFYRPRKRVLGDIPVSDAARARRVIPQRKAVRIRHGIGALQPPGPHNAGTENHRGRHEPCRPDKGLWHDTDKACTEADPDHRFNGAAAGDSGRLARCEEGLRRRTAAFPPFTQGISACSYRHHRYFYFFILQYLTYVSRRLSIHWLQVRFPHGPPHLVENP